MALGKKNTLIFDFGNVIAFFNYGRVINNFARMSNGHLPPRVIQQRLFANEFLEHFETGQTSPAAFIRGIRHRANIINATDQQIIDAWNDLLTPNTAVIDTIKKIPDDIKLVIGSNTNPIHFKYYRREYAHVLDRFATFVMSYEVGALKPDLRFFRRCLSESESKAEDCLYVEDIPQYVDAASTLGIEGIAYTRQVDLIPILNQYGITLKS